MLAATLVLLACAGDPAPSPPPAPPTERVTRMTAQDLRARPRPSDPWSVAREVPGIVLDRVDVGGSETGQQSLLVGRGDAGAGARFTLDGVDVTDPAAPGFAALHPDMALAAAVDWRTDTIDVRVRTPGVQVDLTLPEGGPGWVGGLSAASSVAQSSNLPSALEGRPFLRSVTASAREMSADAGGSIGSRWRVWAGAARRSLAQETFTGHDDHVSVTNAAAKARLRIASATLSLLGLRSQKVQDDRDPTLVAAPEARWRQSGPTHLLALDARANRGGFALTGRASALRSGFRLEPRAGPGGSTFEDFRGVTRRSYLTLDTTRPRDAVTVEAATDRRFGRLTHRWLAGAAYARSRVETATTWPGNQVLGLERSTVFFRAFELTGFAIPTRAQDARTVHDQASLYVQDSARRGRLGVVAGLRGDRQRGRNLASAVRANPEFPELLPAIAYDGAPSRFEWRDVLPRLAVTWDPDAATTFGVAYGEYGAALGAGDIAFDSPFGREVASLTYYWRDANADHVVQSGELDLVRGRVGSNGLDPARPGAAESPHAIDPELRAPRTRSLSIGARHARGSWTASAHGSWRRLTHPLWRPLRGLTLGDYAIRGAVVGEIHGDPYSVGFYAPASASRIVPGNGRLLANREGYHQDALGVEAAASGRWRGIGVQSWISLTDWREWFDDRERAVQDPTPIESDPLVDGGVVAVRPGGLGRGDVAVNARWTAGAIVSARLPWALDVGAVVHARDGFPIPYFVVADTGDPTGGAKAVLVSRRVDSFRLPALALVDVRLARSFPATARTRVTASVDVFNATNASTTLQAARDVDLAALDRPREIVRPRLVRAGLSLRF